MISIVDCVIRSGNIVIKKIRIVTSVSIFRMWKAYLLHERARQTTPQQDLHAPHATQTVASTQAHSTPSSQHVLTQPTLLAQPAASLLAQLDIGKTQ
jgi:site-specific recombinase XerC